MVRGPLAKLRVAVAVRAGREHARVKPARDKPRSPASEAWELVLDLIATHRPRMLAVQAEYGLRPPQFFALQALEEPKPMGKLAEILCCDSSNVTWITDRLEERGLVERRNDPSDRRVKLLALTDDGRRVRSELLARLSEPPEPIRSLPAADARALRDILRRALAGGE